MKFVSISDVHIKEPGDKQEELFLKFLNHPTTLESDTIFLLGDIFDLLVGGHKQYLKRFKKIFLNLMEKIKSGKKIYFIEGNHDFHFSRLIQYFLKENKLPANGIIYLNEPLRMEIDGRIYIFAHGDEIELNNHGYQKYKKVIRSKGIYFLSNYIVPFFIVNGLGRWASKSSRERHLNRYQNDNSSIDEKVKINFRKSFELAIENYEGDILICGHSHVKDNYIIKGKEYWNNGYFPQKRIFHYYDGKKIKQVNLDQQAAQ